MGISTLQKIRDLGMILNSDSNQVAPTLLGSLRYQSHYFQAEGQVLQGPLGKTTEIGELVGEEYWQHWIKSGLELQT